jgi:hypothetical protein
MTEYQNAGKNTVQHRHFFLVRCFSPASAFWHQGQSGTGGPALLSYAVRYLLVLELQGGGGGSSVGLFYQSSCRHQQSSHNVAGAENSTFYS